MVLLQCNNSRKVSVSSLCFSPEGDIGYIVVICLVYPPCARVRIQQHMDCRR
jgi:hypothetical protein